MPDSLTQKAVLAEINYGYLPDLLGHLVSLSSLTATKLANQKLEALALTSKQAVCLYFISLNPETRQKDLASGVGTSPSVMVGILDVLETRGFIRRVTSKEDRRAQFIAISDSGRAILPKIQACFFETEAKLDKASQLSPEERQDLLRLLRKLSHR